MGGRMWEDFMFRKVYRALAVFAVVAAASGLLVSGADARIGGGVSSGSRGSRTFSAPPSTSTSPSTSTMQRTTTQPDLGASRPGYAPSGSTFGRPGFFGGGFFGSLAAGFIGAGLFGLLFGHGLMGGLGGGFLSFLGLIFQLGLIAFIAMWIWRWMQRRNEPAYAGGALYRDGSPSHNPLGAGLGGGGAGAAAGAASGQRSDDVGIGTADYDAFERLLGEIQTAYSKEDLTALRARTTPEMVSYFSEDLAQNAGRGVVNRISDVKLLQGDLAEAWREGGTEYATVAMRIALNDTMVERASGRVVEGGPQEVVESWTFRRTAGGPWMLSAIQQSR
jgi:predicted lipid-binding transport protein (Tim44 family)